MLEGVNFEEMQEAKELLEKLERYVNKTGHSSFLVPYSITNNTHRTLQQAIFNLFMQTIKRWAELPETHYDLRNEFTVKTSKKIMAAMDNKWYGAPFL